MQEWKDIRDAGSKVHSQIDKYIKSGKIPTLQKAKNAVEWYNNTIYKYGSKRYSEVIVFSNELGVAGSMDLLVYDPDKNECSIFDWKTSKKIKKTRGKAAVTNACNGLTDCNFDQYSLQLSMYSYLLNKYHNIPITNHFMVHLTDQGVDCIKADDHSEIIEKILDNEYNGIITEKPIKKEYKVGIHAIGSIDYYFDKCPYEECSRQFKVKAYYKDTDTAIHKEYACYKCANLVHYMGPDEGFITDEEYEYKVGSENIIDYIANPTNQAKKRILTSEDIDTRIDYKSSIYGALRGAAIGLIIGLVTELWIPAVIVLGAVFGIFFPVNRD